MLSRQGYKLKKDDLSEQQIQQLKKDLTAKPNMVQGFGPPNQKPVQYPIYLESNSSYYIPRFYGLKTFGQPKKDNLDDGLPINIEFQGSLRPEQLPIQKLYLDQQGGGIISLKCGGGKTVLALSIIASLKRKTIVLVHKDFLMTQWRERILQFLPDAKIGKIQQDTVDVENKDIVLAMVQSVSVKEYPQEVFDQFGLAVFDECHHLGAEIFQRCMSKVQSKYMLGLSATPKRKDRCSKVFEWYIGPIAYMTKDKNTDYIEVNIFKFNDTDIKYSRVETTFNGKACCPKMINNICNYEPRTYHIIEKIIEYYNEGRDVLYLSDRRNNLEFIYNKLKKINIDSGFYVGGMKPNELRNSQEKQVILGTFSMASEGMDIPKLNTIILGSPKSDIVQSVGRILRQKKESRKFHPLIYAQQNFHLKT